MTKRKNNYEYPELSDSKKNRFYDPLEDKIYCLQDNELHFTSDVDVDSIERLCKELGELIAKNESKLVKRNKNKNEDYKDVEPFVITYIVDSHGGSVKDVLKFVDYIKLARKKYVNIKFVSVITGLAASAGTIMCAIADERKMTENASAMIHELSGGTGHCKYTQIQSHAKFTTDLHNKLISIYLYALNKETNDKKEIEKIEYLLKQETWFTSNEYQKAGFISEIL